MTRTYSSAASPIRRRALRRSASACTAKASPLVRRYSLSAVVRAAMHASRWSPLPCAPMRPHLPAVSPVGPDPRPRPRPAVDPLAIRHRRCAVTCSAIWTRPSAVPTGVGQCNGIAQFLDRGTPLRSLAVAGPRATPNAPLPRQPARRWPQRRINSISRVVFLRRLFRRTQGGAQARGDLLRRKSNSLRHAVRR